MRVFVTGLVLALGLAGLAHAAGDPKAGQGKAAVCAGCHGADGNSAVPNFPKLAGQGERYLVKQITDIKNGKRTVVEMTGLTDSLSAQDIEDIAAYFSAQAATVGKADPALVELGAKLYGAGNMAKGIPACTGCHNPAGAGNPPAGFPKLGGQHAQYIEGQLMKFRSGERSNDGESRMMQDIAANMSDAEIKALASYISGLY
ncbi:cytochrome c4 [Hahella sp. CCB-MM4]|uniref:c-type cytochrome n=1 Tax=Hahella sp. (strain CCB-MM4) TaxID=1926491 RepID=UPI000B9A600B|nr:c-type cytochrome [Hahella sp. CCB-MM4]OZG74950.1 cytochrome c4 [Hahella sp. CCB-MM4]